MIPIRFKGVFVRKHNLLAQSWIEFIVDNSGNKEYEDEYFDEAEHYLIEVFFQKLEEKRNEADVHEKFKGRKRFIC